MALEAATIALTDRGLARDRAFIDGEWCDADEGAEFPVTDPATGELLGDLHHRQPDTRPRVPARGLHGASGNPHDRGQTFYTPTLLDGLADESAIWQEETFGPVAAVRTFASESEAIELANDTPYGLAGYLYSRDVGRIFRVSEQLEYGILGINTGFISVEVAPFGGVKESGIGREGSKYGVEDWIETRYLSLGGIDS
jgi:acyl-CoA reductase-like NAD-dependent aldehyde dehydrogenase